MLEIKIKLKKDDIRLSETEEGKHFIWLQALLIWDTIITKANFDSVVHHLQLWLELQRKYVYFLLDKSDTKSHQESSMKKKSFHSFLK
jgi:hypothetical protein